MAESDSELRRLFERVLQLPAADRPTVLAQLHPDDEPLHRRVLAMIAAVEQDTFLSDATQQQPASGFDGPTATYAEPIVSVIGPYTLLKKIGEGGFGSVYMAEQKAPIARRVAIKIIKPGMDTRQVVARFNQERQSLAILDHPNIARVIEAGATSSGRPYFVMDLVDGAPICEVCDRDRLSVENRLDLFSQVCAAVRHAHSKGIIHRDIKPTNVLVGVVDGVLKAKVIDFGIAKAVAGKAAEQTAFTGHGQLIGTPEYMSPEQAGGGVDVDTRSDVYSLGALLYELLTGSSPFTRRQIQSAAYAEIQRMIREDDPPKPSTRLSKSADTIAAVAASRRVAPQKLTHIVRGELDCIAMKALEKNRDRRYATVDALLADVRRYLDGEVVQAAPPGLFYLLSKFAGKHKTAGVSALTVAVALLIGAAGFAWQARRAVNERDGAIVARNAERRARQDAADKQRLAESVNDFLAEQVLSRGNPNRRDAARPVTLKAAIDLAAANVETSFNHEPLITAAIHKSLGQSYDGMGFWTEAEREFTAAYTQWRGTLGPDAPQTLEAMHHLATTYRTVGNAEKAEPMLKELIDARRRTAGDADPQTCAAVAALGMFYLTQSRSTEALPLLEAAYAGQTRSLGERNIDTLQTMNSLAIVYGNLKQLDKAIDLSERELRLATETLGPDHPETTNAQGVLAGFCSARGRYADAVTLLRQADQTERRVLGEDHPDRLGTYTGLGTALAHSGDAAGSMAVYQDAIRVARGSPLIDHAALENIVAKYGAAMVTAKKYPEAEAALLEAYPALRDAYGPDHYRTRHAIQSLVRLYKDWNKTDEASRWQSMLPATAPPSR